MLQTISNFLSNIFLFDNSQQQQSKLSPYEAAMDSRWQQQQDGKFQFSGINPTLLKPEHSIFKNDASAHPFAFASTAQIKSCLQELQAEYEILTSSLDKSTAFVGSSNTRKRNIRMLRFQLEMLQRQEAHYQGKQQPQQHHGKQRTFYQLHLLRDLDEWKQLYVQAQQEVEFLRETLFMQMSTLSTKQWQQEQDFLSECTYQYVTGAAKRDTQFRSIQEAVFEHVESDPFEMIVQNTNAEAMSLRNGTKYAPLPLLPMNSKKNREERRHALINALVSKDQVVTSNEECDRIDALLRYLTR